MTTNEHETPNAHRGLSHVAPGSGWVVRGTLYGISVFAVAVAWPDLAGWLWLVGAAMAVVAVLAADLWGADSPPTLAVDVTIVMAVVAVSPVAGILLLLPWIIVQNAAVISGDRRRLWPTSLGTMVVVVSVGLYPDEVALSHLGVGTAAGLLISGVVASQVRAANAGTTNLLSRLRGRNSRMLDATSEALLVTSPTGDVVQANAAAADLADTTPGAFVGMSCHALQLREGLHTLDCSTGCALLAAKGEDVEVWTGNEDGERIHLLARATPVLDHKGRVLEVMHALRDISNLRRAADAENLFLSTASHELKTPLTVIHGFSLLLQRPEMTREQQVEMLAIIHKRTTELATIVDRLLLTGRVGSGSFTLDLEPAEVASILRDRVAALNAVSVEHELTLSAASDLPLVDVDIEAIQIVFDHLLENAVKYSPDGGAVDVSLAVEEEHLVIEVADHGIGMHPGDTEHCFKRFWQGDVGERRRFGGTGVGLFVVHELVTGMNGTISASSVLNEGTTMRLVLRRSDVAVIPDVHDEDEPTGMVGSVMSQMGVTTNHRTSS